MATFAILFTVIGGIMLNSQAAVNGTLGRNIGVIEASFISFFTGTGFLAILVLFFGQGDLLAIFDAPKWQLSAVFCGTLYVLFSVFAVPKIGVAATSILVISGQLFMGLIIDHFGMFNGAVIPIDSNRGLAIFFMALALFFVYKGNKRGIQE